MTFGLQQVEEIIFHPVDPHPNMLSWCSVFRRSDSEDESGYEDEDEDEDENEDEDDSVISTVPEKRKARA